MLMANTHNARYASENKRQHTTVAILSHINNGLSKANINSVVSFEHD